MPAPAHLAVVLALVVALALPACGGAEPGPLDPLVDRLPDDLTSVVTLDLAAIRSELDLPAGADPATGVTGAQRSEEREEPTDAERRLAGLTASALTYIGFPDEPDALLGAVDHGRLTAVVAGGSARLGPVAVLRGEQDPDEVAAALLEEGWEAEGEAVVDRTPQPNQAFTALAGEGETIALAADAESARAVLDGFEEEETEPAGEAPDAGRFVARMEGVARLAAVLDLSDCLRAIAVADGADGRGELLFEPVGEPSLDRVVAREGGDALPAPLGAFSFGEPELEDEVYFRVPLTYEPPEERALAVGPLEAVRQGVPDEALYEC